jgi:hypothetical protein
MATYPKQLQLIDSPSSIRGGTYGLGSSTVYSNGFTPPGDVTVNDLLAVIQDTLYGIDLSGATNEKRTRDRYRHFDTSFGDTVVYPGGVAVTSDQAANEMIDIMRVLWDIDRAVTNNSIGYATSVDNS